MKFYQRLLTLPFELSFRLGVFFRNLWFDYIYKGRKFPVKIISVGNLSVGGTGKTPMAEWLIRYATTKNISCAYLSRGYGRKKKGYILVNPEKHTAVEVGDEALQVAANFNIPVAVCENRSKGVQNLLNQFSNLQLVILDDAFQHRSIYRDFDIVMIDPFNPPFEDYLLPTGSLREPFKNINRANLAVISKVNLVLFNEEEKKKLKKIKKSIKIHTADAKLISYALKNCFDNSEISLDSINRNPCYAISAIGNNQSFIKQLFETKLNVIGYKSYKDHYMLKEDDLFNVIKKCKKIAKEKVFNEPPFIVMTEKDYYRLKNQPYFQPLEVPMYYLKVRFELEKVPLVLENFFQQFQ